MMLSGCSSGLSRSSLFNRDQSTYDIICEDFKSEKKYSYYLDSLMINRTFGGVLIKDNLGADHSVSSKSCIFERLNRMKDRPEDISDSKMYQILCKIGEAQFMNSNLQRIDEDNDLFYMRKVDGHVWIVPKKVCPLLEQSTYLGD
jgi:hypothetical protein